MDGVWVENRLCWTLQRNSLQVAVTHKLVFSARSWLLFFVTFCINGRLSAPGLMSSYAGDHLTSTCSPNCRLSTLTSNPKSKLHYDRRSVGQSVLVTGTHQGPATNCYSFFLIIFRQMRVCWLWAPSLTRGRFCSLQLLLGLSSTAFLGFESLRTYEYILLSQLWDSPNFEGQVRVFSFPPEQGSPVIPTGFGFI
jgi:hypothetical protein